MNSSPRRAHHCAEPCVDGIIEASARENETLVKEPLCSAVVIYDFFATSSFGLNISGSWHHGDHSIGRVPTNPQRELPYMCSKKALGR